MRNSQLEDLLVSACPFVSTWLCLTMQPAKLAIDPSQLIQSKSIRVSNELGNQFVTIVA